MNNLIIGLYGILTIAYILTGIILSIHFIIKLIKRILKKQSSTDMLKALYYPFVYFCYALMNVLFLGMSVILSNIFKDADIFINLYSAGILLPIIAAPLSLIAYIINQIYKIKTGMANKKFDKQFFYFTLSIIICFSVSYISIVISI